MISGQGQPLWSIHFEQGDDLMKTAYEQNMVSKRNLLCERAYAYLKRALLNGDFQADERLIETKLAAKMGISRTPLREAIHKLERERFIYKLSRGGHAVSPTTAEDISEMMELAGILFGYAAYLATLNTSNGGLSILRRITGQIEGCLAGGDRQELMKAIIKFCDALLRLSKNSRLHAIFNDLNGYVFGRFNLLSDMERRHVFLADQKTLIKLMETGQASRAEKLGREFLFKKLKKPDKPKHQLL